MTDLTLAEQAAAEAIVEHWTPLDGDPDLTVDDVADEARAVVAAVRPRIWREVARWVRDTCETYDDDRVCEDCTTQADLIAWHAHDIESGATEPPAAADMTTEQEPTR